MKTKEQIKEESRLKVLKEYGILDTPVEKDLDDLTRLAAIICDTPIALITLIDEHRQWFKSQIGIEGKETERSIAFCDYTIRQNTIMEVPDATKDIRFLNNPFVTGEPNIRFYSGAPLITDQGYKLGSLCVVDKKPKMLSEDQRNALEVLARQVINYFDLKQSRKALELEKKGLEKNLERRTADLIQSNKELDRFVYSASHELRAPLKSMLGLTYIALKDLAASAQQLRDQYIQRIEGSIHRLDKLVNDITDYSRNSRLHVKAEEINFTTLLSTLFIDLSFLEAFAVEKKFYIEGSSPFFSDKSRIIIILSNIISNALKYADSRKEKSIVHVNIKLSATKCQILVRDNGIGMEEKYLKSIFDMFYRITSLGNGAGLGLYIVKETIQKLQGKIEVNSVLNEGTQFRITLHNLSGKKAVLPDKVG